MTPSCAPRRSSCTAVSSRAVRCSMATAWSTLAHGEAFTFNTTGGTPESVKPSAVGREISGMNTHDLIARIRELVGSK